MQTSFNEPRLLILTDPRTDHQSIREAALGNIPTIAFCDTDFTDETCGKESGLALGVGIVLVYLLNCGVRHCHM
jgi:hypothetical protein